MKILMLAPHPFYQDRGTPIAAHMVLKALSERGEDVDVLTYPEGKEISYDHVKIRRIKRIPFVRHIRPGFSWKKILCDISMFFRAIFLAFGNKYDFVHAVEEAAFIGLSLQFLFGIPYLYDMDSCLPEQLIGQFGWLVPFRGLFNFFEKLIVKKAEVVVPVCEALSDGIMKYEPKKVVVLQDISLLKETQALPPIHVKKELGIEGLLIMYVGNLEEYQGIDLLLESFARALKEEREAYLVIIGGETSDIEKYRTMASRLGIQEKVCFLGPRPVEHLAAYLSQADILTSPRLKGRNTPMKLYSYLDSGKAILATDLETHTQVLSPDVAMLALPSVEEFSKGLLHLMKDERLRLRFGASAKKLFEEKFSDDVFRKKLNTLYDELKSKLKPVPKELEKGKNHSLVKNDVLEKEPIVH